MPKWSRVWKTTTDTCPQSCINFVDANSTQQPTVLDQFPSSVENMSQAMRLVADGIAGPRVPLGPGPRIFRIAKVGQHVDVLGVEPDVQAVSMLMPLDPAVVHPQSAPLVGFLRLQNSLTVTAKMIAVQPERMRLGGVDDLLRIMRRLLLVDVIHRSESIMVVLGIMPGIASHSRIAIELVPFEEKPRSADPPPPTGG